MTEAGEQNIREQEAKREETSKRWETLKERIRKDEVSNFDIDFDLPDPDGWKDWKDWNKIFELLGKHKDHRDFARLFQDFRPDYDSEILEMDGLAIALMTNPDFYNELRKQYPTEKYKDEWNTFFSMYASRLLKASINIHRMPELNYRGYDFRGINPGPFFDEFADCRGADFEGSDLSEQYLKAVDFRDANLKGTNFNGAYLLNANFEDAITDEDTTTFYGADIGQIFDNGMPEWAKEQTNMEVPK